MCLDLRVLCTTLNLSSAWHGAPCTNLDIPAIDVLLPKFIGGMQPSSGIYHIRKWGCLQDWEEASLSSKKCFYHTQPFSGYHSQKLLISGKSSMSFLLRRSKTEFSKLVGSLVLSSAVSHYFVFHCHPRAISVF